MKKFILIISSALALIFMVSPVGAISAKTEINKAAQNAFILTGAAENRSLGGLRREADRSAVKGIQPAEDLSIYQSAQQWIRRKQAEVTRQLSGYITELEKTSDNSIALALVLASLIYGLVHAAGPGHGKVIVSSYVLANHQTMRRGIMLAFLSAFVQGTVAVLLVGSLAIVFGATGSTIKSAGLLLTQISYILIILLGLYLLYKSLNPLLVTSNGAAIRHGTHDHVHDHTCNHKHLPEAAELEGSWTLAKIASLTLSVGLRPCTGAIFVLVFAFVKGLFWAGVLSVYAMALGTAITISAVTIAAVLGRDTALFTLKGRSTAISLAFHTLAIGASLVIILFGLLLLTSSLQPARPF